MPKRNRKNLVDALYVEHEAIERMRAHGARAACLASDDGHLYVYVIDDDDHETEIDTGFLGYEESEGDAEFGIERATEAVLKWG